MLEIHRQIEADNCLHCGSKLTGRWETLSQGLCRTLVKFYEASNGRPVHLQKDCSFTKTEFNNFQKLKYFQLVTKTETAGVWKLTGIGLEFVKNRLEVFRQVYVFRNEVTSHSEGAVKITEAMKSEPYWLKKEDFIPITTEREPSIPHEVACQANRQGVGAG